MVSIKINTSSLIKKNINSFNIFKKAKNISFSEEVENDKNKSKIFLERVTQAKSMKADQAIIEQEEKSAAVYKRALLLIGSGDMKIISNAGEEKQATENNLPVSSYLSHGSRILIEIPKGNNHDLMNWLTSGDKNIDGRSKQQTQSKAINEQKIVYNRSAATHTVEFKKHPSTNELIPKEKKGFFIGAKSYILNTLFNASTPHWGVDLAMNAKFAGKDSTGQIVDRPDGDHGHLYIYYKQSTKEMPGALLIGMEGGAPSSKKHSKTGAINTLSAVDGSKFDKLDEKQKEGDYKNTIIPKTLGGMVVKLNKQQIDDIVKLEDKNYGTELAVVKPAKSSIELNKSLKLITQAQAISTTLNKPLTHPINNTLFVKKNTIKVKGNTR